MRTSSVGVSVRSSTGVLKTTPEMRSAWPVASTRTAWSNSPLASAAPGYISSSGRPAMSAAGRPAGSVNPSLR